ASRLTWDVAEDDSRNYNRTDNSLELQHSFWTVYDGSGPQADVPSATWPPIVLDPVLEGLFYDTYAEFNYPDLSPNDYLVPGDLPPASEGHDSFIYHRTTAWLWPADYHVLVRGGADVDDAPDIFPEYRLETRVLCEFTCEAQEDGGFFGIPSGDDWFDAYDGITGRAAVASVSGGSSDDRSNGLARGIACPTSPYNGYIDDNSTPSTDDDQFIYYPKDIDVVSASGFGQGYVNGTYVTNNTQCTGVLRVDWEAANPPLIAWRTTHDNLTDSVFPFGGATVSTTNDDDNPFYAHTSPASAFSAGGWTTVPDFFDAESGSGYAQLTEDFESFPGGDSAVIYVEVAIAHNPLNGDSGTDWTVRYFCAEDPPADVE
ncbi:MAG: hypothetical protein KC561_20510, partial [Myxococcales bacterium]|nr:hypothetical protein [Myxococcales bacterium]